MIRDHTFYACESLKTIDLPDTVTIIRPFAFLCCYDLSLFVPSSVVVFGDYAFDGRDADPAIIVVRGSRADRYFAQSSYTVSIAVVDEAPAGRRDR